MRQRGKVCIGVKLCRLKTVFKRRNWVAFMWIKQKNFKRNFGKKGSWCESKPHTTDMNVTKQVIWQLTLLFVYKVLCIFIYSYIHVYVCVCECVYLYINTNVCMKSMLLPQKLTYKSKRDCRQKNHKSTLSTTYNYHTGEILSCCCLARTFNSYIFHLNWSAVKSKWFYYTLLLAL